MSKKLGVCIITGALIAINAAYAVPAMQVFKSNAVAVASTEVTTSQAQPDEKDAVTLSVSRATIGGTDIIAPTSIKVDANSTVWSVLQKALDDKNLDYEYTYNRKNNALYVTAIDGIKAGANGTTSGWMFNVNGKVIEDSPNNIKAVEGDKIEWKYTKDGGKDIGTN
ncbi:DUF4430 domain-containing protein [Candidatus Epulonipiscium viviparus]|uniref:DUF4430 domain-containing protein n=1 Tax=Candidatus Epulonipiscium viviparus TaxID=420336 RepID=UPI00016C0DDD|nr:DUF4430 domain-containing protein [Candidatus Epulopiscium viviparus]